MTNFITTVEQVKAYDDDAPEAFPSALKEECAEVKACCPELWHWASHA